MYTNFRQNPRCCYPAGLIPHPSMIASALDKVTSPLAH